MSITTTGLPQLLKKFADLKNKHIKAALRKGTRAGAKVRARSIKSDLQGHDKTGKTSASVKVRAMKRSRKRIGAMVIVQARDVNGLPYPSFVELGDKSIQAQHTIKKAAGEAGDDALRQCNQTAAIALEKAAAI